MKQPVRYAVFAAAWLALAWLFAARAETAVPAPARIEIKSAPIEFFNVHQPEQKRFGKLEFRGGIALTSINRDFGGISGLVIEPDGSRFLAVTDRGFWVSGNITSDGDRPTGIANAEIAPVIGPDGQAAGESRRYDMESLTRDGNFVYAGVERVNEILRFNFGKDGLLARAALVPVPPGVKKLGRNTGLEALAFVPKGMPLAGTLLAFGEAGATKKDDNPAFLIGGPSPGNFFVQRIDDFDSTDAAIAPGGKLILLERHFSLSRGVLMRIRRFALADIRPGARLAGEILLTADFGYEIDNMEGLAVHVNAAGETILTIISDDNFNPLLQRTILLRFAVVE